MSPSPPHPHGNKPFWLRHLLSRPQLFVCLTVGVACALALPTTAAWQPVSRALAGWNIGAVLYLVLALHMMFRSSHEGMRRRALMHDEGSWVVLLLVITAALMCIAAIVAELAVAKDLQGNARYLHIGLASLTIATSWAFTQVMFALHYAHDYYACASRSEDGGLLFPGDLPPDYADFLYFACIIGTSAQTADVSFVSRRMRKTGTVHCVLAFFFNTTLLALTINMASSLL